MTKTTPAKAEPRPVDTAALAAAGRLYGRPCEFDHPIPVVAYLYYFERDGSHRRLSFTTYAGYLSRSKPRDLDLDAARPCGPPDSPDELVRRAKLGYTAVEATAPEPGKRRRGRPKASA